VNSPIIIIPARMASTRLPNKPLADIGGAPMIVRVWQQAVASRLGPVIVACAEQEIADAVEDAGGVAVMTDPDLPSGSDRVWQALGKYDPDGKYDIVVNLQGDLPTIEPEALQVVVSALTGSSLDIATLAAEITDMAERDNPNVVKAVFAPPGADDGGQEWGKADDFTRVNNQPDSATLYHHIGIYAFRRDALARFVGLPPSAREIAVKLEQLRALDAGMTIAVACVDTVPLGVDTAADLEQARSFFRARDTD